MAKRSVSANDVNAADPKRPRDAAADPAAPFPIVSHKCIPCLKGQGGGQHGKNNCTFRCSRPRNVNGTWKRCIGKSFFFCKAESQHQDCVRDKGKKRSRAEGAAARAKPKKK